MKLTILSVIISRLPLIACDVCEPGYFWSSKLGCNKCFCSGVTNKCHAGSFNIGTAVPDIDKVKGFVDWPEKPVGPLQRSHTSSFDYEFNNADASGVFIWEFPFPFYENGARSYGGFLSFSQKTTLIKGGYVKDEPITVDMISSELNISIVAMPFVNGLPRGVRPLFMRYDVQLTERNAYIDGDRSRPATRADMMRVLLSANKLLVVSGPKADKKSIHISFVTQEVAVDLDIPSESIETDTIEVCDCPEGYSGNSCESCKDTVCKPCENIEPCEDLCYDNGMCLGCPQCYECIWYHRNINNKAASVFGACEFGLPE